MLSEPKIEHLPERPYLVIQKSVHQRDIPNILPPLIPEVKEWMNHHRIEPAGVDFFHYKSMNVQGEMGCEVGFTVHALVQGDGRIVGGAFPAGTYASIVYTGDFKNMMEGHMALESWIKTQGLKEKTTTSEGLVEWGGRTEFYLIDPDNEPDPNKWQTEIMFLLQG
ncbi:GyrI-like domain-containing protein [Dyadobacter arcticus]|uniref:Effector-binding domain-containing protein n=1 Tax=Dyadobacter arcticus TaxID=1078754 RepID=A0ABX0UN66_9BACT|nr:GyrI-like domain-containing protein [Dyadobacter arcticus]NIJ54422.1 effector-binding domain-containing protein [Dyadobacter arcticus]